MQSDSLQCASGEPVGAVAIEAQAVPQNQLRVLHSTLAPTSAEDLELLADAQDKMMSLPQAPIFTEHVLHAGMYSRTITMPPGVPLVGALIKVPTLVITVGTGKVFVDGKWRDVQGYQVIPGCKGRKQAFYSISALVITMIFPTKAKTVEEAEREFTDEHELLLSRRQDLNRITITEEA